MLRALLEYNLLFVPNKHSKERLEMTREEIDKIRTHTLSLICICFSHTVYTETRLFLKTHDQHLYLIVYIYIL